MTQYFGIGDICMSCRKFKPIKEQISDQIYGICENRKSDHYQHVLGGIHPQCTEFIKSK